MRRYFRHILLSLISVICTVSCIKELDDPNPVHVSDTPTVLVPRVKSFTNQYITKAGYTTDETQISSLTVLVFNNNGQLVHIQQPSNLSSIELNKSMLDAPGQDVTAATIVMIANVGLDKITDGNGNTFQEIKDNKLALTLEGMENCTFDFSANPVITSISDNFTGFPMIGGVKNVNLSATKESQNTISVPLKILYAKINFSISVANGTENTGTDMNFTLNGYSVHNVANKTGVAIPTEKGEPVRDFLGEVMNEDDKAENDGATDSSDYTESGVTGSKTGTTNVSGQPITFTFYIAESRYNHNSDLKGIYPSDDWLTTDDTQDGQVKNGVKSFYDDLIQQYKPKLANVSTGKPAAGLASYVLLNGTYVDYRGTSWNVNYTVYLGKDNAQNFHVDRNSEYTNHITIKGIRNNDSYYETDPDSGAVIDKHVWIDHRVDVSTDDLAGHVAITRETLIDSHIEVRPLRVSWDEDEYVGVRVYLPTNPDGSLVNWIGIERFTDENCQESATYCYKNGKSTGKRKYFTTDLISELQSKGGEFGVNDDGGNKYIYLLNGECAWIYFDENTTSSDRSADITLSFYPKEGDPVSEVYKVTQRGLQTIAGYTIESYEEYLHSYDSADKYNLSTSPLDYTQQGFPWGNNANYSGDIIVVSTEVSRFLAGDNRYDYFHLSDGDYFSYIDNNGTLEEIPTGSGLGTGAIGAGTGLDFTDRGSAKFSTKVIDMGTEPESAYQYCLSKNKFTVDADDNVSMNINWYLPDVYEMKEILTASTGSSMDFKEDALYWSSQPSYEVSSLGVANEVTTQARAVSKSSGISDETRSDKNRIRCVYTSSGISLSTDDMKDRVPDGIGGNYSFVMKAHDGNQAGHYGYMLQSLVSTTDTNGSYDFTNNSYAWPTFSNPGSDFGYLTGLKKSDGTTVNGFSENPADPASWELHYTVGQTYGYYTTLASFPGLTMYELEQQTGASAYKPGETPKQDVKVEVTKKRSQKESTLTTLDKLDEKLDIVFSSGLNAQKEPLYRYSIHQDGSQTKTITRYWDVPTYNRTCLDSSNPIDKSEQFVTTSDKYQYSINNLLSVEETAQADALNKAKQEVLNKYPNCIYSYGTPTYDSSTSREGPLYNRKYYITVTCSITVNISNYYYEDAVGGGWNDNTAQTVIETHSGLEYDQLEVYCGNSFTISVSDNSYVISKVKVYYSGNNHVSSSGTDDNVYSRFVDSEITLPQSATISKSGSTETLQLQGMDYYDDTDSGTGTHQWSGDGRESVTLVLADYFVNNNILSNSYTYEYKNAESDFSQYIIIDKIEVKCTPKSTTGQ